ncbi:MAG: Fe-S-containing protein [Nitrospirota bacterium]
MSFLLSVLDACSRQPSYPPPTRQGADIVIDIAGLQPETPKFYTYYYQGKKINFFVCRIQDKVLSFLDACASCYTQKRGYRSEEGKVTCRDCNMKFSVYQLEKGLGSCYPIKIEGRTKDGKYLIPVAALEGSADMF